MKIVSQDKEMSRENNLTRYCIDYCYIDTCIQSISSSFKVWTRSTIHWFLRLIVNIIIEEKFSIILARKKKYKHVFTVTEYKKIPRRLEYFTNSWWMMSVYYLLYTICMCVIFFVFSFLANTFVVKNSFSLWNRSIIWRYLSHEWWCK